MAAENSKTILIVEDEHEVRTLAVLILEEEGYRVLEAAGASEALRLWESNRNIDLLIIDIWLPEMRGVELAERFLSTRTGLQRIFLAGFAARIPRKERALISGSPILKKPFAREDLFRCVHELIGKEATAGLSKSSR